MKYRIKKPVAVGFYLLIISFLFSSCSPGRKVFSDLNTRFQDSPVFQTGFSGFVVYDPQNKKLLYQYNGRKHFTPASNTKLLTFYTGLKILGDSVPAIRYSIRPDSLIFSGTGDPSLLHPELPESRIPTFLKESDRDLYYLPTIPSETPLGPGWAWDDYNAYYSVERSVFPIYGNQVIFSPVEDRAYPETVPSGFGDSIVLDHNIKNRIRREWEKNLFRYPGNFRYRKSEQVVPFRTSTRTSIQLLEDALGKKIQILNPRPGRKLDSLRYSIPTDSIYKRMLQVSDNFIAEQILLLAARELSDTMQTAQAIQYMKKHHLQDLPDELKWVDGSGLSRYNLTTPRNMIRLLEKIQAEVPYKRLFQLLPAGGETGTLKEQFKGEVPFIFAKTGSLSNNYSLSGFLLTEKGKILLFSFMNSNFVVESALLKQEMEGMLRSIRNNF